MKMFVSPVVSLSVFDSLPRLSNTLVQVVPVEMIRPCFSFVWLMRSALSALR